MSRPLISVALCTWNGARHLDAQLASLLAQDYPTLEIVAVDDVSSDDTLAILERHASRDARLTVHRNEANLGHLRNFERALSLCRGELLAPCDQDDIWAPDKLSRMAAGLGAAPLVYCDSALMDIDGRDLGRRASDRRPPYAGADPRVFAFYNCASGHAMLFTRALLGRAQPFPTVPFHDQWLAFVATQCGGVAFLDAPLVRWRQHASSQTDFARGKTRAPGQRRAAVAAQDRWLAAVASWDGPHRAFFLELHRLWRNWQDAYVNVELPAFLFQHRAALFRLAEPGAARWLRMAALHLGVKSYARLAPRSFTAA